MPSYRVPNYFQAQTPIGEGIQSLAGALFSGPGPLEMEQDRLRNAYMTAQTEHAQTQNKIGQAKLGAGAKISDFLKLSTAPIVEGQNRADLIRSGMGGLGQALADSGDIGQLAQVIRAGMANSGASDNDVIRAQAGAGQQIGVNDAVSLGGQQAVASRNQHDLMDKTRFQEGQQTARNSADIAAANSRNSANIAAAQSRLAYELTNKPLEVSAGATMYTAPGDVRGKGGPLLGRETETIVNAAQARADGGQGAGPYKSHAIEAQDSNIILRGIKDPAFAATPEYAMAYERQYATPKPTMTEEGMKNIMPVAPSWAPRPANVQAQPGASEVIPGTERAPSHDQGLAAGFANRIHTSNQVMDGLSDQGAVVPSLKDRIASKVPVIGGYVQSNESQQLDQAQRDFINAQLRRESGAAIGDSEFDSARKQYFVQPGEERNAALVAQKAAARKQAEENMVQSAGNAYRGGPKAPAGPRAPTQPPGGGIPTFANPNDPALVAMPSGSVFYTPDGKLRTKP